MLTNYDFSNIDRLPLCVDLDGTLIFDDVLWVSIRRLLWRNPLTLPTIARWWAQGRAHLKQQLAQRITIDPATLSFNQPLLAYLAAAKRAGFNLHLVTAADHKYAQQISQTLGIFDDFMASDGVTNLRAAAKAQALIDRFGDQKFIYAGNSVDDIHVWRHARHSIVVNPDFKVSLITSQIIKPIAIFN